MARGAELTEVRVERARTRGGLLRRARPRLVADGFLLLVLALWYFSSLRLPEFVLPNPVKVLTLTARLFLDPPLLLHTAISLGRVVASVLLALAIGSTLVLAARYLPVTGLLVGNRLTPFFNSFPSLGWAILAVIWFGVSDRTVLFVETAILLPFCMINMWEGIKNLDPDLLEMAGSFGRRRGRILRKVIFPLLFPYIFSALRISFGVGWKVSLIAELFGAHSGLGYLLEQARQHFDMPMVFATICAIILLVAGMERLVFDRIERRVLRHLQAQEASPL
jgi:NitT/TauT family transport system permease protein/sulfonate transport system permease protein